MDNNNNKWNLITTIIEINDDKNNFDNNNNKCN